MFIFSKMKTNTYIHIGNYHSSDNQGPLSIGCIARNFQQPMVYRPPVTLWGINPNDTAAPANMVFVLNRRHAVVYGTPNELDPTAMRSAMNLGTREESLTMPALENLLYSTLITLDPEIEIFRDTPKNLLLCIRSLTA
jgi:hypothetical protein